MERGLRNAVNISVVISLNWFVFTFESHSKVSWNKRSLEWKWVKNISETFISRFIENYFLSTYLSFWTKFKQIVSILKIKLNAISDEMSERRVVLQLKVIWGNAGDYFVTFCRTFSFIRFCRLIALIITQLIFDWFDW